MIPPDILTPKIPWWVKPALITVAAVLLMATGSCVWRAYGRHQAAGHLQEANKLDAEQTNHGTEAVKHEAEAQALAPILKADDGRLTGDEGAIARDRAEVARLRPAAPAADPAPAEGQVGPQLVPAPLAVAPLDAAKDQLIADLTQALADAKQALEDTRAQAGALTLADQERLAQVQALQAEILQLRASIAAQPRELHWGLVGIYGTNQTLGAGLEYDLSVIRAGIDIVRRQVAGGQTTLEAVARVGFRF